MRNLARCLSTLLLYFVLVPDAFAAGFNCSKAITSTEKAICNDLILSSLDEELSNLWQSTPRNLVEKRQQKDWLQYRDAIHQGASCQENATKCLSQAYEYRILELTSGCEIGIVPPLWDGDFSSEELDTVLGISNQFETCRLDRMNDLSDDFEALSDYLNMLPLGECAISFDVFMYPISERRGYYVMSRCDGNTVDGYQILLEATLNLIRKRNANLIDKISSDTLTWHKFSDVACDYHSKVFGDTPRLKVDKCREDLLKFRILYLSPLIGIDEFYGFPASSIDEVLGEYYGYFRR